MLSSRPAVLDAIPHAADMASGGWRGAVETLSKIARAGQGLARSGGPAGAFGLLEARLAGVLVTALQKAFEHDRTRLDIEAAHAVTERERLEAERQRAERAFRAELQRQAADRAAAQARLLAVVAVALWITSAVLAVLVSGMHTPLARVLMGAGWVLLIATLAAAAIWHQEISQWRPSTQDPSGQALPRGAAGRAVPWLLTGGLTAVAASLLVAL